MTALHADEALEPVLTRADEALFCSKNGGRNQVQIGLSAA